MTHNFQLQVLLLLLHASHVPPLSLFFPQIVVVIKTIFPRNYSYRLNPHVVGVWTLSSCLYQPVWVSDFKGSSEVFGKNTLITERDYRYFVPGNIFLLPLTTHLLPEVVNLDVLKARVGAKLPS